MIKIICLSFRLSGIRMVLVLSIQAFYIKMLKIKEVWLLLYCNFDWKLENWSR